ncbi:MAG: hypothetical protein KME15_11855 [Drouetiella hepatica Uher 2000/2452]|uniref:Uncharacterized protein n=1 Tax=Drouetiella hepatica Uher 2000/2452 TaxID=904376 RepID=A0A951UMI2_9CYAN|nr:hypothetical protein [Drouetiella hepatica Uher 2000/2452]
MNTDPLLDISADGSPYLNTTTQQTGQTDQHLLNRRSRPSFQISDILTLLIP